MADYEQKLKNCYEYDPIEPREGFLEELMALETKQKRRRGYVLPIAAAVAAMLLLAFGWARLHAARPESAPASDLIQIEPAQDQSSLASDGQKTQPAPKAPVPPAEKPADPSPVTPEEQAAGHSDAEPTAGRETGTTSESGNTPAAKPDEPTTEKPAEPEVPTPDEQQDPKPDDPEEPKPDDSEETKPDEPVEPNPDPPVDPDPGEDNPAAQPQQDDPEPPQSSPVGAVYLSEDGRETLTLTLMSTGESVELDVTDLWPEKGYGFSSDDPTPASKASVCSGVYKNFGFDVYFFLERDSDGTVYTTVEAAP